MRSGTSVEILADWDETMSWPLFPFIPLWAAWGLYLSYTLGRMPRRTAERITAALQDDSTAAA